MFLVWAFADLFFFAFLGFICNIFSKNGGFKLVKNLSELPIFTGVHTRKISLT